MVLPSTVLSNARYRTEIHPSVERRETSAKKPPDRRGRSIAVPASDAQIAVGTAPYFPTSGFERTAYTAYASAVTTTAMGPVTVTKESVSPAERTTAPARAKSSAATSLPPILSPRDNLDNRTTKTGPSEIRSPA